MIGSEVAALQGRKAVRILASKSSRGRGVVGPDEVRVARLSFCRREMKRLGVAAYLVSRRWDGFYLTGFTGEDSAILITAREVHVISDGRFEEVIRQECPWVTSWIRSGSLNAEIAKVFASLGLKKVSVQWEHRTVSDQMELKRLARGVSFSGAPLIVSGMRRRKDDGELAVIRKAIKVAEAAFLAMRGTIRVGDTELELAARLEYEMKRLGAAGPSFPTICAVDGNASLPHAHPGGRRVKQGSAVLFDWGARLGNYCSDLTRMVFVGSIPPRIGAVYNLVLEAQRLAILSVRPGRRMCEVDAAAREFLSGAGYSREFSHGLGHGLGMDVHEPPSLSWRSDEALCSGMVVTVEPGVYLPGIGGVRIEDDVLVTDSGCKVMSRLGKKLEDCVVALG